MWNRSYFFTVSVPVTTFEKLRFRFRFPLLTRVTDPVPVLYLDHKNTLLKILPFYILSFLQGKH